VPTHSIESSILVPFGENNAKMLGTNTGSTLKVQVDFQERSTNQDNYFLIGEDDVAARRYYEFESRPIHPDQQGKELFCEAFDLKVQCEFDDDAESVNDFDITVKSDLYRQKQVTAYDEEGAVQQGHGSAATPYIRRSVQVVSQPGLYGKRFNYEINRVIPTNGNMKFGDAIMRVIPKPELDEEFYAGSGSNQDAWPGA